MCNNAILVKNGHSVLYLRGTDLIQQIRRQPKTILQYSITSHIIQVIYFTNTSSPNILYNHVVYPINAKSQNKHYQHHIITNISTLNWNKNCKHHITLVLTS